MSRRILHRVALSALASALVVAGARRAEAVDCTTLPTPVYITGSSAFETILGQLASALAAEATPVTIVYQSQGSCAGVDAIASGMPLVGSGATAPSYWDASGAQLTCDLPTAGVIATIGVSDAFPLNAGPSRTVCAERRR